MFDFVQKNKRLIQIVLGIIFLPFAFFGVDAYFRGSELGASVAVVAGHKISQQEFTRAVRERQEMMRNLAGGRADVEKLDTPEFRFAVLDNLIRQRLVIDQALRSGMTVTDQQLRDMLSQAGAFQEGGRFSNARYEQFLKSQGLTPGMFEQRVKQDMLTQHVSDAYNNSDFVPRTVVESMARLLEQQREISQFTLTADSFTSQVKLEEGAAKKYYESHQDEFRVPEQVRVQFVVLSGDAIAGQAQLDPAEVRKYYDEHRRQYEVAETRKASHILIAADSGAAPEARSRAKAKADQLYAQIKQKPGSFAELARTNSEDPGSASKGGDLGYFSRGNMVKVFDDAVFGMKTGEISAPVESPYGYHIIRLDAVKPGQTKSFEEVRPQIEAEMRKVTAGRKFAEAAEAFNNLVFEQSDSLKPAAEFAKAQIQTSGWITRTKADDARLANPRLLQAIFSDDVLNNKRNTEAVEVAPGQLVSARIVEHKPAAVEPFESISATVTKKLVAQRAAQLAAQEGRSRLDALKQGKEASASWGKPVTASRVEPKGLTEPVLREAFKADASRLPAYAGVEDGQGGYTLLKVTKVVTPEKLEAEKQKGLSVALTQVSSQEQFTSYLASLKQKGDVKIQQQELEKKSQ